MAASGSDTDTGEETSALIPRRRKVEIVGLILMVGGLLLTLAFLTYSAGDNTVVREAPLGEALWNPGEIQSEYPVENMLGLIGAQLARILIPGFLGYGIVLLSGLLLVCGYTIFRHQSLGRLSFPSILTVLGAFILATAMGWLHHALDARLLAWSGAVGIGVAGWLQNVFGMVGSFILLLFSAAVLLLLAIDHDVQRTVDRLIEGLHSTVSGTKAAARYVRDRWNEVDKEPDLTSRSSASPSETAHSESAVPTPERSPKPSSPSPSPPPSSATLQPSDGPDGDVPVRRNDLFRWGDRAPLKQEGDGENASTRRSDDQPSPPATSGPPAPPEPEARAASNPEPEATPSVRESDEDDVSMTIQEQVEEETAEEIERPAAAPEDFEYEPPPLDLLDEATQDDPTIDRQELEENKRALLDKLDMYNIEIEEINAVVGPTVTRYELTPAPGIKISRIKSLEDDLAMAMAASGIRIIAPIPGKSAVGVEIPNRNRELVRLRDVIGTTKFRDTDMDLPIPLGKTIEGEVFLDDLTQMPHLLIAGATGSGKSVGLNAFITGLIYACHPANLRFVIIDPKKIELQQYTPLETQFVAVPDDIDQTVITDIDEAAGVLKSVEKEMETRYELLSAAGVRNINGYNEKYQAGDLDPQEGHRHMPYLVVVVDELADLMMSVGDEVEGPISRLAQMARAVGIHLVLATQRPSVDVITGLIKANFSSRIAFEVASRVDSRTILDQGGAEGLVGNGDMLFLSGSDLRRIQGPFVSVEEVERVVKHVANQPGVTSYTLPSLQDAGHGPDVTLGVEGTDDKFKEAARIIVRRQQGSVSLLQRKLAIGYTRAARIVDQLEEAGIVGPFNGTKARDVLVDDEEELNQLLEDEEEASEGPPPSA